ncbi:hypothetical protein EDD70_2988 [Hydrogenoanaerobacterium saccharovorans]|uniref:Bacteriophage holin of superfamily 6 (Holin_LLH) n=1 Tax=Hydrogenoanaerobacterium saccharovorans TaxID=474960 RepID=A0A1H7YJ66_9FIRM|nr:hypothetical protein [Hydrogenoanaerobacterium saccharovorans]RPF41928.1 hypothetical protein EDD70_2988 [Hydrogenoanaerobacterium saccharovorans]SEM46035.1 hypothetical protein SAMN05216180_0071 [Hydrogenoanaerobacterium saccharovorans]
MDKAIVILQTIAMVVLGAAAVYYNTNAKLKAKTTALIAQAEDTYKDVTKAGGGKRSWVVDRLYALIPNPLRVIITRDMVETIVQNTFDEVTKYAKLQLDKAFAGEGSTHGTD